jgi:competence protein ComEA
VALVTVSVVVGAGLGLARRPAPGPMVADADPIVTVPATIRAHVGGWVVSPGVVAIPTGSLVADAVAAAGGMRPGAAADAINLAAPVSEGDQILVPAPGAVETGTAASDGTIALNRATAVELEVLPGVGPVLAERIVSYRESHGSFDTVDDLLDVPGIGESKLAAIRDLVRP